MGVGQFETTVRGDNGTLSTTTTGTVETDNYGDGGAYAYDGSAYPYTLNPAAVIQELVVTKSADIVARITTTGGSTFDLNLNGATGAFDKWTIDSVEFRDPNATAKAVEGGWAGE